MTALPWINDDGGRHDAGYRGYAGDCATRAVAIALQLPYQQVYNDFNDLGKRERLGKRKMVRSSARAGVWKPSLDKYLMHHGWKWVPTMFIGSGTTVHLRQGELPPGRIIARVSGHMCAVIDGVIHDTHDPARGGDRAVYGYWCQA